MMKRILFYGFGIHIEQRSGSALRFKVDGHQHASGAHDIDLSWSPNTAVQAADPQTQATAWGAVVVDDQASLKTGGASRVPHPGSAGEGILYVTRPYADSKAELKLPPHGYDGSVYGDYSTRLYELSTLQYPPQVVGGLSSPGRRYYGFHGKWMVWEHETPNRKAARLFLWDGGCSLEANSQPRMKIVDLDNPDEVHPDDQALEQQIKPNQEGPIYLSCLTAKNTGLLIPKLPVTLGGPMVDSCKASKE
jgi:hypothetical protein